MNINLKVLLESVKAKCVKCKENVMFILNYDFAEQWPL